MARNIYTQRVDEVNMIYVNTSWHGFAMEMGDRLRRARIEAGFSSAMGAAKRFGWSPSTYAAHENGQNRFDEKAARKYAEAFKTSAAWLLTGEGEGLTSGHTVPIMGYIGAGAEIQPEFEQVPPEGLDTVELPFPVPDDMIGLEVRGDSMLPAYSDGDVVVVYRDQRYAPDTYIGEEAAVRTHDGRRFLKRLAPGPEPHTFTLESFNARPIIGARLAWIGEIWVTVKRGTIRRIDQRARAARTRRERMRAEATAGTDQLPFAGADTAKASSR
ncbi:S24 family peptidase [Chelatococcus sp. XZ-Ab1]|uniref:S24 family peptidase n=1 Tax=Chelatococcus sp. XZ-Ab1 TaxID=3034027 RepID=UPI0023E38834|nr:S24 family peptidase [Chelatococcus sp. XZ-Ab1]